MRRRTLGLIVAAVLIMAVGAVSLAVIHTAPTDRNGRADIVSAEEQVSAEDGGAISLSGATLIVPPGAISADSRLRASIEAAPTVDARTYADFVSPASTAVEFELLDAEILHPLQISFAVPRETILPPVISDRSDAVWMSFFVPAQGTWEAVPSRFDPVLRTVTSEVSHLSWWMPETWDWRGIELRLRQSLTALGSGRAPAVACPSIPDVTVSNSGGDDPPLVGCASDAGGDNLRVTITNNRAYAMVMESPDGAELGPRPYAGFEEYLETREGTTRVLGGPYLAPTSTLTYTVPRQGERILFAAEPSLKTRVFDLAAPAATAVFNVVTAGYADCILDAVARSGPAPLSDAPALVVQCLPVLAQIDAFVIEPLMHFVESVLGDYDLTRDAVLATRGEVALERASLPPPNLYISTGYERGALYAYPNFPDAIGINNHEYFSEIEWTEPSSGEAVATAVLNENDCVPSCSSGTYRTHAVEITASKPIECTLTVYEDYSDVSERVYSRVYSVVTIRALSDSPQPDLVGDSVISTGCA